MIFRANRYYDANLDIRAQNGLASKLRERPPDGALWILVAPRRARKTWTLKAVEHLLSPAASTFIDLRQRELPRRPVTLGHCYLLDEPGMLLEDRERGTSLVNACRKLYDRGGRLAIAVTPYELEKLVSFGSPEGIVSEKAIHRISPLAAIEARQLASRSPIAEALLDKLAPIWKRNAFLLELLFEIQETNIELDHVALLRALLEETEKAGTDYFKYVFWNGLTHAQRSVIQQVARGDVLPEEKCRGLAESGLIDKDASGRFRLSDPILEVRLSSLRIHHLSDVHIGPKSAQSVDTKVVGAIAVAADAGAVRDSYLAHLEALKARGQGPHLVAISGDLTEWASQDQLDEASRWVDRVRRQLVDHLQLAPDDPRILLVGGNHDVDWGQARGKGPTARHLPFAEAFPTAHRPRLELQPEDRKVASVHYPDFGIEFLLLGSAALGGEIDEDLERAHLLRELSTLVAPATLADRKRAEEIALRAARDDAGLVHHVDLSRANAHPWRAPVRIAVIHHPVSPLPSVTEIARYSGLLNAGAVKDLLLAHNFCLVLHGHAHSGWLCAEQWPNRHDNRTLHIAAAPSLSSRETLEHLGFNEIEIQRDYDTDRTPQFRIVVRRFERRGQHNWEKTDDMSFVLNS